MEETGKAKGKLSIAGLRFQDEQSVLVRPKRNMYSDPIASHVLAHRQVRVIAGVVIRFRIEIDEASLVPRYPCWV